MTINIRTLCFILNTANPLNVGSTSVTQVTHSSWLQHLISSLQYSPQQMSHCIQASQQLSYSTAVFKTSKTSTRIYSACIKTAIAKWYRCRTMSTSWNSNLTQDKGTGSRAKTESVCIQVVACPEIAALIIWLLNQNIVDLLMARTRVVMGCLQADTSIEDRYLSREKRGHL